MNAKPKNVDEYIISQPAEVRATLEKLRHAIRKAAPKAEEVISYNMPGYKLNKLIVWFAAAKNHYGLYPFPKTIEAFKNKLKPYELSKGTIRFPYDKPVPVKLISDIVKYNAKMDKEKAALKKKKINN
jgi:uncharacterized protein YdhG (YjbR/CyaY superfamily)